MRSAIMSLHKTGVFALLVAVAACAENPADVRNDASAFPLRANWNAAAAQVGTSGVSGTLTVKQFAGFRMEVGFTLTGGPTRSYQWRIFRGNCATTTTAANNNDPNGLLLFATVQSYPDITTTAGGAGASTRDVAGSLDSLLAYSVRVRVSQTATNWNGTSPIACGNLTRTPA
jgi:hypothetical protein